MVIWGNAYLGSYYLKSLHRGGSLHNISPNVKITESCEKNLTFFTSFGLFPPYKSLSRGGHCKLGCTVYHTMLFFFLLLFFLGKKNKNKGKKREKRHEKGESFILYFILFFFFWTTLFNYTHRWFFWILHFTSLFKNTTFLISM